MPNMSYCRYENTVKALEDCVDDLELRLASNHYDDEEHPTPLSRSERRSLERLIESALRLGDLLVDYSPTPITDLDDLLEFDPTTLPKDL